MENKKFKFTFLLILSLIVIILSGIQIYKRVMIYLYNDKIEITGDKKGIIENNSADKNETESKIEPEDKQSTSDNQKTSEITQKISEPSNETNKATDKKEEELSKFERKAKRYTITYTNRRAKNVKIKGSFFLWKEKSMKKIKNGVWEIDIYIKDPGKYKYYFIVDGKKVLDPKAKRIGNYSILEVK